MNYQDIKVLNGTETLRVAIKGSGIPLVYLHPSDGLRWDGFLEELAKHYMVYAIEFPGTTVGNPYAIHKFFELNDIVLAYEEVIRKLNLDQIILVGQSFGGMLAAELASYFPKLVKKLVLLDAIGLWDDQFPIPNWNEMKPEEMPGKLFHNLENNNVKSFFNLPEDLDSRVKALALQTWSLGCTGKFVWPIPDCGLAKRIYRLEAFTLIIWGEKDALVPVHYAKQFNRLISNSQVKIIPDVGHIPQVEAMEETLEAVKEFLAA
ncbi:alpha/beta hydrolase [Acinetobacter baumannii]